MVSNTRPHVNWWLIIGGVVLVICGCVVFAAPSFFLEFLTVWAGAGFLVSGVMGIVAYFQLRGVRESAGFSLIMAMLDFLAGLMLILHPIAFAGLMPWMLGAVFIAYGVFEIIGVMPFAISIPETRVIAIISGVLSVLVGVMFIVWPASLSIWVAAFALVRGITLVASGVIARA